MTWLELECIRLRKINQSGKDKYNDCTHMWNLREKYKVTQWGKERKTKKYIFNYRGQTDGYWMGGGAGDEVNK